MSIQPADHAQTEPIPGAATPSQAQAEAEDLAHHTCDVLEFEFRHLHAGADEIHGPYRSAEERFRALWRRVHALTGEERRMALCLSGGGIRSATFCLGVLQGLAQGGWLGRFHYLSTVSGGGYIGSWLTSWIQRREQNTQSVVEELSNPAAVGRAEPEPVRRLRAYSNYLSPVWGLSTDFVTLIAIFLRNLMLHWLAAIPLLLAVITLPRLHLGGCDFRRE